MKRATKFFIEIGFPIIVLLGGIALSVRSCYHKESEYADVVGSMEYFNFKDGSEEIKFTGHTSDKTYIALCKNFNGDNTIDQIKTYQKGEGNSLNLEQFLDRNKDFESNRYLFERADKLLLKLRNKN